MKKLILITLISMILMSNIILYNSLDYALKKDELIPKDNILDSKQRVRDISRSLPVDISTIYNGETVTIVISNGTTTNIESTYQYNSINNISHFLTIIIDVPLRRAHEDILIKAPDGWNYSTIEPAETVSFCGGCNSYQWDITHAPGVVQYNMTFLSGDSYGRMTTTQNQYLTIDDTSDSYLSDSGFEIGFGDWSNSSFDSVELNTSVYYSGDSSIMLTDTDDEEDIFTLNSSLDLRGDYYISIPIFVEESLTVDNDTIIQYYNDGWNNVTIDSRINFTDQWEPQRFLVSINGEESTVEFRVILKGAGRIHLDDFTIWEVNSVIIPGSIIHSYNVSSSLISWDSRENFGVDNERVDYNITLTNTNSNINSTSLTTDTNGFSSYLYTNSSLDEAQLTVSTRSDEYFVYNTFNNLQSNEVLRTDMNDGSGTVLNDLSVNGFDGVIDGAEWVSSDIQGSSLDFEAGNTDFVNFGNDSSFSFINVNDLPFSFSCFFKIESTGGTQTLISKLDTTGDNQEWIFFLNGGKIFVSLRNPDNTASIGRGYDTVLSINIWYHLVITYSAETETANDINMYLNSSSVDDIDGSSGSYSGMTAGIANVILGAIDTSSLFFDGIIDNPILFEKELSQSEINYLYQPAQEFQSQPRKTNERPFNYETKTNGELNEWDFKEGTNDNFTKVAGTITNESGYLQLEHTTNTGIRTNSSINADIYDSLEIRVITNVSVSLQIQNYDSSTNFSTVQSITSAYQILSITLTGWSGTQPGLRVQINGSNYQVRIDYIRLIHTVTPTFHTAPNLAQWWLSSENDTFTYQYWTSSTSTTTDNTKNTKTIRGTLTVTYSSFLDSIYSDSMLLPSTNATGIMLQNTVKDDYGYFFFLSVSICVGIIIIIVLLTVLKMTFSMFKRR